MEHLSDIILTMTGSVNQDNSRTIDMILFVRRDIAHIENAIKYFLEEYKGKFDKAFSGFIRLDNILMKYLTEEIKPFTSMTKEKYMCSNVNLSIVVKNAYIESLIQTDTISQLLCEYFMVVSPIKDIKIDVIYNTCSTNIPVVNQLKDNIEFKDCKGSICFDFLYNSIGTVKFTNSTIDILSIDALQPVKINNTVSKSIIIVNTSYNIDRATDFLNSYNINYKNLLQLNKVREYTKEKRSPLDINVIIDNDQNSEVTLTHLPTNIIFYLTNRNYKFGHKEGFYVIDDEFDVILWNNKPPTVD